MLQSANEPLSTCLQHVTCLFESDRYRNLQTFKALLLYLAKSWGPLHRVRSCPKGTVVQRRPKSSFHRVGGVKVAVKNVYHKIDRELEGGRSE